MRSSRLMTSLFLVRHDQLLLLYRRGSRAIDDSWVGIGGHLEPAEMSNPAAGVVRELEEEIGVSAGQISGLALRYVALRDTGTELRHTYYFTAVLKDDVLVPSSCAEGDLRWFDLTVDPSALEMPPTARLALGHWLQTGRYDEALRFITIDASARGAVSGGGGLLRG
ncbi:NUDIX domain-containing protein [Kribbella sp. NPDC056951]|uniref:NUDIX domain-containing protein n=1 Tax=Kribbella sp. NPDC056951 TaxID=3345978 RepID=UPI003624D266